MLELGEQYVRMGGHFVWRGQRHPGHYDAVAEVDVVGVVCLGGRVLRCLPNIGQLQEQPSQNQQGS